MADYQDIRGLRVKYLSADPADPAGGEVWYNSTTGTLKSRLLTEAWSSGGNLIEANYGAAGAGTQTAFLYIGGAPYPAITNATREYNGSGWSTTGNYIGAVRYFGGCGTQTAALAAGGLLVNTTPAPTQSPTASAEYDGSTWTTGNAMANQRNNTGSNFIGVQTAAIAVTGASPLLTPRSLTACEDYDGTNFSTGTVYPAPRQNMGITGTQTAGIASGGLIEPPQVGSTEVHTFDGSSWTSTTALPAILRRQGAAGTETANLVFSGTPGPGGSPAAKNATTLGFDGTTWSAKPSMAIARASITSGGVSSPSTAAIGAGGYVTPSTTASTEEFNQSTSVFTAAAWASAPSLSTGRYSIAGTGTNTAALATGGTIAPGAYTTATEKYDGSSWTAGGVYPAIIQGGGSTGPQTAALYAGGYVSGPGVQNQTATFDGSSWTVVPGTLNTARVQIMSACVGTQAAAMVAGGDNDGSTPYYDATETYDGSTWTTSPGTLSSARTGLTIVGTSTVAVTAGGGDGPGAPGNTNIIQTWNGSAWATSPATLNTNKIFFMKAGATSTAALFTGGDTPGGKTAGTELWDGTIAVTDATLATATAEGGGAGQTTSTAIIFGGITPLAGNSTVTQEFTAASTAANIETLTTS